MGNTRRTPGLAHQAGWLLLAKIAGFAIAFTVPLLIVRVLDQHDFGLYKQAFLIVSNATPLLTLAFYMNVFYFLPRQPEQGPRIVQNVLIVHLAAGLVSLAVLLAFPQVLAVLFGDFDLVPYAPVLGLVLCLYVFGYFLEVVATASQDVGYSTAFIVLSQLTRSGAMYAAVIVFGTLEALLYAVLLQGAVQSAAVLWYLHRRYPGFMGRPDWSLMRAQVRYAVPLGIAGVAALLETDLHMYFVANRFSAATYAIYAVGCFQVPLLGILRESANAVLIPRISHLQQQDDRGEIILLLANAMRKLAFAYWPVTAFLAIMAPQVIEVLYTSRYAASVPIFVVNVLMIPTLMLLSDPVTRAYTEHIGFLLKARIAAAALMAPAVYFGISYLGMQGAVIAMVAVVASERLILMYKVIRILSIGVKDAPLFMDIFRLAFAALCGAAGAGVVRRLTDGNPPLLVLACAGAVFSAIYVGAVVLMRIPTSEETKLVRGRVLDVGRMLRLA